MRIDLNLAREPFRNRTLFWLLVGVAYVVAFAVLMFAVARAANVGAGASALRDKIDKQEKTISDLEAQIAEIKRERGQAIFLPTDRIALDDARQLLTRRSFSWSRLLGDLEPNVPAAAKISSIEISKLSGTAPNVEVSLAITGVGQNYAQMAEFLERLDRTGGRFSAEPVSIGQASDGLGYEFTITAVYRPNTGFAEAPPSEAKEAKSDA